MHHGNHPVKSNDNFKMSWNIKFNLILVLAIVLTVSGITLSLLNNLGVIGKLNPIIIRNYNMSGEVTDIFTERNYAYIASGQTGLQIIKIIN